MLLILIQSKAIVTGVYTNHIGHLHFLIRSKEKITIVSNKYVVASPIQAKM